jgi:hypothetical protein
MVWGLIFGPAARGGDVAGLPAFRRRVRLPRPVSASCFRLPASASCFFLFPFSVSADLISFFLFPFSFFLFLFPASGVLAFRFQASGVASRRFISVAHLFMIFIICSYAFRLPASGVASRPSGCASCFLYLYLFPASASCICICFRVLFPASRTAGRLRIRDNAGPARYDICHVINMSFVFITC